MKTIPISREKISPPKLRPPSHSRFRLVFFLLFILLVASAVIALTIGPIYLTIPTVINAVLGHGLSVDQTIVWQIRFPRIVLAAIVGVALAASGTGFQSLLRNDLADPYILGISSGASSAVAVATVLGLTARYWFASPVAAFCGSLAVLILVLTLSSKNGRLDSRSLLLNGVIVSAFLWSIEMAALRLSGYDFVQILNWLMGSLAAASWHDCIVLGLVTGVASICLFVLTPAMNLYSIGEESARQLGLEAEQFKRLLVVGSTVLAAAAVSVAGIIGFIGLIGPHIARRMLRTPDHRFVLPTAGLCGAILLLWSDTAARNIAGGDLLPVGIVTAFLGAPFFCYQMRRA